MFVDTLSESQLQYFFDIIASNTSDSGISTAPPQLHIVTNNNYNYMYAMGMNGVNQYGQQMNGSFNFGINVIEYFMQQWRTFSEIMDFISGNSSPELDSTPIFNSDLINQDTKNIMGEYVERVFKFFYDNNLLSLFDDYFQVELAPTFAEFLCTDYILNNLFDDLNYMPSVCIGQPIGTYQPPSPGGNQGQNPNGDTEVPPLPPDPIQPPPVQPPDPIQPPPVQPPVSPGGNIRILKGLIDLDAKKGKFIYE